MLLLAVHREKQTKYLYIPPADDVARRREDVLHILLPVPGGAVQHAASAPAIQEDGDTEGKGQRM
jgi:hypothetical protein